MNVTPHTIIIVENDIQTVTLLNHMFCHNSITLVSISSNKIYGLNALIKNYQPTLIILDYMSIRRDYDTTCNMLNSFVPHIPTVLMTSIYDDKVFASFDYTIKKPFYRSDLFMIMQDVVEKLV